MREKLSGAWVAAILTGVIGIILGFFITEWLSAPSWSKFGVLIVALLLALVVGRIIDKGTRTMTDRQEQDAAPVEQAAFIKVRGGKNIKIINNSVSKGAPLLDAERTSGLFVKGNKQRD